MLEHLPICEFAEPGALRDRLVGLVAAGAKTATSSLLAQWHSDPLPVVGERFAVVDSRAEPLFAIEITGVDVVPIGDVTVEHAVDEGEGFESVADWWEAHAAYWRSDAVAEQIGRSFELDAATPVVLERFHRVA